MNLRTLLLSIVLFFGVTTNAFSQEKWEGAWEGTLTQDEGGLWSTYFMELYLKKVDGKVVGRSDVRVDNIYIVMDIDGESFNEMFITLKDDQIIKDKKSKIVAFDWCFKKYQLILKKDGDVLEGFWEGVTKNGVTCVPGKIFLRRKTPRA